MGYLSEELFVVVLDKWIKMVAFLLFHILRENEDKPLRRDRVFSDRSQVLDTFTDEELFGRHKVSIIRHSSADWRSQRLYPAQNFEISFNYCLHSGNLVDMT